MDGPSKSSISDQPDLPVATGGLQNDTTSPPQYPALGLRMPHGIQYVGTANS